MDADGMSQALAASIEANGAVEAAKIIAAATIDAAKLNFKASLAAVLGGSFVLGAAWVSTRETRERRRAERDAYRHLVGGLLEQLKGDAEWTVSNGEMCWVALEAGKAQTYKIHALALPAELAVENWRRHGLLGSKFARHIVELRKRLEYKAEEDAHHGKEWIVDPTAPIRGLLPTKFQFKMYLDDLRRIRALVITLDACTKTLGERTGETTTALVRYVRYRVRHARNRWKKRK